MSGPTVAFLCHKLYFHKYSRWCVCTLKFECSVRKSEATWSSLGLRSPLPLLLLCRVLSGLSAVGCPFPYFCETHFRRLGRNQTLPPPASCGIHKAHPRCSPSDLALASKNASLSFVPPTRGDLDLLLLSVCGWPHHPWWLPSPSFCWVTSSL